MAELHAPRTETEKALVSIWSEVLKVGSIGIQENFFDLGGHSLLVIRAVSRIRDVFEVDLAPSTFFAHPTVAGLARVLVETKGSGGGKQRIERQSAEGPSPLSYAQERLWFLDQLAPGSAVYNIVDVVRFEGPYNGEAMQGAVNELVRRHETLRTAFRNQEGQPVQIVFPAVELVFAELDLRSLPETEREQTWMRRVREEGRSPFQLTEPPLLRGIVVHLSEQQQLVLLTCTTSLPTSGRWRCCSGNCASSTRWFSQGKSLRCRSCRFATATSCTGSAGTCRARYWRSSWDSGKKRWRGLRRFWNYPPTSRGRRCRVLRARRRRFELSPELLERLKRLSRQQEATLFMTLAAGFMALLYRYTGQDDILVGTPISGRTRSETEDLIGFFLNLVVLRAQFTTQGSFRSLLQQMRQRALGAYGHQDLPFEQLVAELAPERGSQPDAAVSGDVCAVQHRRRLAGLGRGSTGAAGDRDLEV